jgi:hypothetical protein
MGFSEPIPCDSRRLGKYERTLRRIAMHGNLRDRRSMGKTKGSAVNFLPAWILLALCSGTEWNTHNT